MEEVCCPLSRGSYGRVEVRDAGEGAGVGMRVRVAWRPFWVGLVGVEHDPHGGVIEERSCFVKGGEGVQVAVVTAQVVARYLFTSASKAFCYGSIPCGISLYPCHQPPYRRLHYRAWFKRLVVGVNASKANHNEFPQDSE